MNWSGKRFDLLIGAGLMMTIASSAMAMVVFDPTNFVKNSLTAAQTAAMYATQLEQKAVEIQQYMALLRNLQQVPAEITRSALGREMVQEAGGATDLNALLGAGGRLLDVYRSSSTLMDQGSRMYQQTGSFSQDMNRFSVASGMTWNQILAYERSQAANKQALATNRYQQAEQLSRQIYSFQHRADQQLQAAGNAQGAVDALGNVAALSHTMTDQLSTLTVLMANRERDEARKVADEGISQAQSADIADKAHQRQQQISGAFR